jgi:hypothetical protein
MTVRVQGGTAGMLAALAAGRVDPLDPFLPEERKLPPLSGADRRALIRRDRFRERRLAMRSPF